MVTRAEFGTLRRVQMYSIREWAAKWGRESREDVYPLPPKCEGNDGNCTNLSRGLFATPDNRSISLCIECTPKEYRI